MTLRPVAALSDWLEVAEITKGAVFRTITKDGRLLDRRLSDQTIALVVKRYADLAGLPVADFSGHSLRAGFVTSAADRGADLDRIMDHDTTRRSEDGTADIRQADRYKNNAGDGFL